MERFEHYQELINEIQERTNFDLDKMSIFDRVVVKEVYIKMKNDYQELINCIDMELDKLKQWEESKREVEDIDGLPRLALN